MKYFNWVIYLRKINRLISIVKNLEQVLPLLFSFKNESFFTRFFVIIIFLLYFIIYVKVYQNDIAMVYQKFLSQKIHFVVVASPLGVDLGMSKSGLFIPIAMDCLRLVFHTLMSESQSDIPKKLLSFLTFA